MLLKKWFRVKQACVKQSVRDFEKINKRKNDLQGEINDQINSNSLVSLVRVNKTWEESEQS